MKVVTFTLADKEYAVDIHQVKEVIRMRSVTRIPDAADFVEGVINLRGKVLPLVNLRKKLGYPEIELGRANRIIVAQTNGHQVGIIVDRVNDVTSFDAASLDAPDEVLKEAKYLIGVGKLGKRLVLLVDIHRLLSGDDKASLAEVQGRVEIRKKQ